MTSSQQVLRAALTSSDPERSGKNLSRFIESGLRYGMISGHLDVVAELFAVSQFLSNFCISRPEELYAALGEIKTGITGERIREEAGKELPEDGTMDIGSVMRTLRIFKKKWLLRITLRDIKRETDILGAMEELSALAETITSVALRWSLTLNRRRFGEPSDSSIALIGLGKLGGRELNYSSDVDLMAVYASDEGQTSGVAGPSGIRMYRISNHEFYCKVMELFNRLLSSNTDDGIAYRVDLRLRPQGQKGDIALPLKAYKTYYESWGRTWERMALLRARPVAGDMKLGELFIRTISPFLWRGALDFKEIEEIRSLKKKIDSAFVKDDIKRGYGGIREAEFFVQTFQLIYGAANSGLRSYRVLDSIQALKEMDMVPAGDLTTLWENYLFLRRVEHYLQMKEDLQTHKLPSSVKDLDALSGVMGFSSRRDFLAMLRLKKMQIRNMYNSLLGTKEDLHTEALNLLEGDAIDDELKGYLVFRKVRQPEECLVKMKSIREHMNSFRTMQERSVIREVVPLLFEEALSNESPDRAMAGLEKLLSDYHIRPAHLTALMQQKELLRGMMKIFSLSPYLTRIFLSAHRFLDLLIEEWRIVRSLKSVEGRFRRIARTEREFEAGLATYRRFEEIRIGMLFLLKILKMEDLFRGVSHTAEAIIRVILDTLGHQGISVIALGKLGGREMTFGSDLDIVFMSKTSGEMMVAEKMMKTLTSYTASGQLYSVDARLRPDGSKGILVKDLQGYRNYYLEKAHNWEIQALLKARPVGGDEMSGRAFMGLAKEIIMSRGCSVRENEIREMRQRIIKELSQEQKGIDIKLGPGGIEEIEFYVQSLQLRHAGRYPDLLVQNTLACIKRLGKRGLCDARARDVLVGAYTYFRTLETFLRLNEEQLIVRDSGITALSAVFMGHRTTEEFLANIEKQRKDVLTVTGNNG